MNLHTRTDIDHAIRAAEELHDLRAGQTGTARPGRTPRSVAPADQPPVEFTSEDDDRTAANYAPLHFVSMTPAGRSFWNVAASGDYLGDVEAGKDAAFAAVMFVQDRKGDPVARASLLGWIIEAIATDGSAGHMVGFASGLTRAIAH